jgi:hypothetical protein
MQHSLIDNGVQLWPIVGCEDLLPVQPFFDAAFRGMCNSGMPSAENQRLAPLAGACRLRVLPSCVVLSRLACP